MGRLRAEGDPFAKMLRSCRASGLICRPHGTMLHLTDTLGGNSLLSHGIHPISAGMRGSADGHRWHGPCEVPPRCPTPPAGSRRTHDSTTYHAPHRPDIGLRAPVHESAAPGAPQCCRGPGLGRCVCGFGLRDGVGVELRDVDPRRGRGAGREEGRDRQRSRPATRRDAVTCRPGHVAAEVRSRKRTNSAGCARCAGRPDA